MKGYLKASIIGMIGLLVMSCATLVSSTKDWQTAFTPQDLNSKVKSGQYLQKVDSFLVILDASGSMDEAYKGKTKLNLAKDTVSRMNQTIPDLDLTGALRIFGRTAFWPLMDTKLLYGLTKYSKGGLEDSLNRVSYGRGVSPIELALNAAGQDLAQIQGNIAIIVFSDGEKEDMNYGSAIKATKSLKEKFGERLCIYTVLVGNDPDGRKLMEEIADAGQCGFSVNADQIASSGDMADFVERVFLAKAPPKPKVTRAMPLDSDGDGVFDDQDKCPHTPKGVKVDAKGCPLDNDFDGVYDYLDRCPETPLGAKVDPYGCWIIDHVLFDFDKADIKPKYYAILDEAVRVLQRNPGLKMQIQGHTCSIGSAQYNMGLSERRAKAVEEYLVKKGVNREQISTIGYGLTRPVATNLSREGRALNRRAELHPYFE